MRFFVVLRHEIARFNFLHPATWYLNFTLRTAFLCSLNRFKSTTHRADGYRRAPPLLALRSRLYKTAVRLFSSPSRYRPATVLKQALLHCF